MKDENFLKKLGEADAAGIAATYGFSKGDNGNEQATVQIKNKNDFNGTAQIEVSGSGNGYKVAVWSEENGQDDLVWYTGDNGRWTRAGAVMGSGKLDGSGNGNGFGCIATYGYGWGGSVISKHGGFDALMYCHVYLLNTDYGLNCYGSVDFWPRVKIQYDANGGSGAPAAHYKYIGTTANISSQKPQGRVTRSRGGRRRKTAR